MFYLLERLPQNLSRYKSEGLLSIFHSTYTPDGVLLVLQAVVFLIISDFSTNIFKPINSYFFSWFWLRETCMNGSKAGVTRLKKSIIQTWDFLFHYFPEQLELASSLATWAVSSINFESAYVENVRSVWGVPWSRPTKADAALHYLGWPTCND